MKPKIKVYLHSEELREKAQKKAFEMGLKLSGKTEVKSLHSPFWFFDFNGKRITRCDNDKEYFEYFINSPHTELTPEEWFNYELPKEEMTDEEILSKVWRKENWTVWHKITGIDTGTKGLLNDNGFIVSGNFYTKNYLLKNFLHAPSLEAVARGEIN